MHLKKSVAHSISARSELVKRCFARVCPASAAFPTARDIEAYAVLRAGDEGAKTGISDLDLWLANCYFAPSHGACNIVTCLVLINLPSLSFELDVADS